MDLDLKNWGVLSRYRDIALATLYRGRDIVLATISHHCEVARRPYGDIAKRPHSDVIATLIYGRHGNVAARLPGDHMVTSPSDFVAMSVFIQMSIIVVTNLHVPY